jgi:hypothetical protein
MTANLHHSLKPRKVTASSALSRDEVSAYLVTVDWEATLNTTPLFPEQRQWIEIAAIAPFLYQPTTTK